MGEMENCYEPERRDRFFESENVLLCVVPQPLHHGRGICLTVSQTKIHSSEEGPLNALGRVCQRSSHVAEASQCCGGALVRVSLDQAAREVAQLEVDADRPVSLAEGRYKGEHI